LRRVLPQVVLIGCVYGLYSLGRYLAAQQTGAAFEHADEVWRLERGLHVPNEQHLQHTVLGWPHVIDAANTYYRDIHFTVTFALLAWLCWFREEAYGWIRNTLIASIVAALIIHFAYPLAPPRMLHGLGFVDTGAANTITNH
jgi:PAP2 superfamily protein